MSALHILAVECCEHVLSQLKTLPAALISEVTRKNFPPKRTGKAVDLIVIGLTRYPIRRFFLSDLRRTYPSVPVLILRREETTNDDPGNSISRTVRGEFVLSDTSQPRDLDMVVAVRDLFPLANCIHTKKQLNYDVVRQVMHVIAEHYPDPKLNLKQVAEKLPISPSRLSRILNNSVGVSFRELLRQTRIEEAKKLLASKEFSVKEVALRTGFSDSHYFSRSFKAVTGLNASTYQMRSGIF